MSAGMAYEAMNNAGILKSNLLVILNDNDMSISRPVGAMSNYLAKLYPVNYILVLGKHLRWLFLLFQKDLVKKLVKQRIF